MLRRLLNKIKEFVGGSSQDAFEITPERRYMMIDFQRRDAYWKD
jgi:hypothetical protein